MTELASRLRAALRERDAALDLRDERADDADFVTTLYADTRREELAPVAWPESAKRDFLADQCRLQHDHYRRNYIGARFLLIERAAALIGRLYVHETAREIRLMDIALLHVWRGRGIGTALLRAMQAHALEHDVTLTLHVEPTNPAQRLYARLGFALIENRGVYDFLGWTPPAAVS